MRIKTMIDIPTYIEKQTIISKQITRTVKQPCAVETMSPSPAVGARSYTTTNGIALTLSIEVLLSTQGSI